MLDENGSSQESLHSLYYFAKYYKASNPNTPKNMVILNSN